MAIDFIDELKTIAQENQGVSNENFVDELVAIAAEQQNVPISSTLKDIGVSVGAGVPNVLGTLADVVDMATGDSIDVVGQFGDAAKGVGQQILNEGLSPETLAQRQAISKTVANENTGIGDVAMSMFKNPMGALTMGAESAATMLVPGGAGVGLAKAAPTIGKLVPRVANALTPARAGAIGATGANALLNAGDTFGELEGQTLADRYLGASVPLAVSALLGPGMESMAVKRIIGAADTPVSNSIKEGLANLGKGALKGGAKEFVSEAGEGGSQAVGEAIGKGEEVNPTQIGKQAFLEGALGAAPGAVGGGLSNVKMAEPKNEPLEQIEQTVAKLVEDAQKKQAKPEDVVANVLKALGGLDDKYQESKPQEEVKPEPVAEQTEQTPVAEEPQAQTEVRRIDRKILQNRKRDDKDSVNQMRKIANAPDYGRVGYSRDFANGAPVVAFGSIPEEQKGRTDYAVSVTGERIPVQYAVVDADTVSTSNDINGAENPDYGLTDRVTAIAGNGRMTALGQAYRQGSAQAYRQEMTEDTMHGVNPQAIAKMKNPVLVRIMPNERVRDDIGDMSNISSNKSLSAIETARNDANRVDLDSLEFNDDGTPTRDSLSRFVSGMPDTERGSMMDKEGRATVQAVDRLNNAIFAKAYNNDDITAMYAEATDPEAKLVVNALARLAPKMAKLEGCGELDFRNALVDAVNAIVQGKRKGLKMQDILAQQDFLADPDVALFVELFARNPRSNKDVVAILSEAADFAYNEATKSDEDMFGEVQKASRGDVMNYVRDEFNKVKEAKNGKQAKQQANVQDASGGIGASQNVDGRDTGADSQSNERAGSANAQADEGFSLSGQTEQEIIADEKAEEERKAAAQRQEEADAKQRTKEDFNKEVDSLNESYADNFSLEDDTVSAEDALRGQKPLFSRKKEVYRHQTRTLANLTTEEKEAFDAYLDSLEQAEGERIRGNIERYQDTQWGHIALECVFLRGHIKALMNGEEYTVETMLDRADMKNAKSAIEKGADGVFSKGKGVKGVRWRLLKNNILADVAKCGVAVNGSFLNCNPSPDCAKFCYAADGRGGIPLTLLKSELVDMIVANDPDSFAQDIYDEYVKTTPKIEHKKYGAADRKSGEVALRLFEQGDGADHWIPLVVALNKRGIRVQVFSKRTDFLRKVPEGNLRLLSIDKTNRHLANENPDLPIAFVYQGLQDVPELARLFNRGQVKVTLPVKLNGENMDKSDIDALKKAIKGIHTTICPIDGSSQTIGSWTCEHCDMSGCAGCFHGDKTADEVVLYSEYLDLSKDLNSMSLDEQVKWLKQSIVTIEKLLTREHEGNYATEEQQRKLGFRMGENQTSDDGADSLGQSNGRGGDEWFDLLTDSLVKRHADLRRASRQLREVEPRGVSQRAIGNARRGSVESRGAERPIRFWGHEKPRSGNIEGFSKQQNAGLKFSRNPRTGKMDIKLSIAWHGSPHIFEVFLTDHIGTGEGAQAHGWGLYFTAVREIAERYRDSLYPGGPAENRGRDLIERHLHHLRQEYANDGYSDRELFEFAVSDSLDFLNNTSNASEYEDVAKWLESVTYESYNAPKTGRLFRVEIPDVDVMLDEQKAFDEQPEFVRKALQKLVAELNKKSQGLAVDSEVLDEIIDTAAEESVVDGDLDGAKYSIYKKALRIYLNNLLDGMMTLDARRKANEEVGEDILTIRNSYSAEMMLGDEVGHESLYQLKKERAYYRPVTINDSDTGGAIYRALWTSLGSPKAASKKLNEYGIKGITYDGRMDGRCYVVFDDSAVKVLEFYSKNKPEESTSGSTVEDVTESLVSDKDIGEAFATLRDSGEVNVVQSIEDLPEEIRSQIDDAKESRRAPTNRQNVERGMRAVRRVFQTRADVKNAMYRDGLGWIDFDVGFEGKARIGRGPAFRRKGQKGMLHVAEARYRKDGDDDEAILKKFEGFVKAIAYGTFKRSTSNTVATTYHGSVVVLRKDKGQKNWDIVTMYYDPKLDNRATGATKDALPSLGATLDGHTGSPSDEGAVADYRKPILGQTVLTIKRSDNGDIQGLYDPRTRKAYLIADALTDETAKPVFLHELGVHSAYSKNPLKLESQMKLARNMVNNGYAQGNEIAVRVKQRLFDANEIDSMDDPIPMEAAEECLSYLVEETASTDDRGPFRKWFDSLMTAIKQWLRNHGINVNLNEWDFVEMAKGNVVAMARQSGKEMSLSFSKKGNGGSKPTPPTPPSNGGRFLERDELGRFRLKAGRKLIEKLGYTVAAVDSLLPAAYKIKNAPQALRIQIREMKAKIEKAGMDATEMAKLMKEMPEAERKLVSDVVEQELAPGVNPPAHVLQIATKITQIMDDQAQELVDLGMLSQESYDRYRGKYLPRFYLKAKDTETISFFAKIFGPKARMRGVAGTHLKGRGIFKEVPAKAAHNFIKLGWEVRDPNYEYVNGKVQPKQGQISGVDDTGMVMLWRDYTKDEREQMGEIRDASYRFAIGYMETQRDLAIGRLFKAIASNPEWASSQPQEGFVYIPKNEVPDAGGVLKYGALAGKYVDEVVLSHISHIEDVPDGLVRAFRQGMAFWKEGKTAMNPVSHMNNTVGNFVAAHLAGVDMWDVKSYSKALHSLRVGDASFKEAQDAGLFSGSFSREEFVQSLPEDFKHLAEQEGSVFKKFSDTLMRVFTWGLRDKMRNAYEFEDAFFKMAIYQKARDSGMDPQHAVDYAHKFVFVYDTLPEGARKLRNSLFPFFAWTYQAVPMLATAAVCYPWRFFAPAAILFALNKAFFLAAAGDDDDTWAERWKKASQLEDAERTLLPKYMQGSTLFMTPKFLRLGIDEATGLPQYINLSHMVPGGNFLDFENQMGGVPLPEILTPNHPLLNAFMAYIGNRDMFSGFDMTKKPDTTSEKVQKYAEYTWKQLTPAIAIGNYHWGRLMDGMAGATGVTMPIDRTGVNRHGEVMPLDVAIKNMVGLKVRTFDPDNELNRSLRGHKSDLSMIQSEKRSAYRRARAGALPIESYQDFAKTADEKVRNVRKEMGELRKARATVKDLSGK